MEKRSETLRNVRRFVTVGLGLAAVALGSSVASANDVTAKITCTSVTFNVTNFPNANNNSIHETVFIDGGLVADLKFSFNGPSGSNTVAINVPSGTHTVAAITDFNTNGVSGNSDQKLDVTCGGEHGTCTVDGSINSNFNGTAVVGVSSGPAYIWFNSNCSAKGITAGHSITLTNSKVIINGTPYSVPNAKITFAAVSCATTSFDTGTNTWITTVPVAGSDEIFLSGLAFPVNNLPGGASVSWQGTFGSDQPGACLSWKWGAAAYKSFTTKNGDPLSIDYNAAQIKAAHSSACNANNGDHAGTPQNPAIRSSVTGGARGGGGSNFTGSWSGTGSLCPVCK